MQADRFTIKSREALDAALAIAAARRHSEAMPLHLLAALLEQGDSIVPAVLRRVGASVDAIRADANAALDKLPTVQGETTEPATSREMLGLLRAAEREAG